METKPSNSPLDKPHPSVNSDPERDVPLIQVRELTKTYADSSGHSVVALDRLSFSVVRGEVLGLIGSNGAGKSTALRILSTMLKPTRGIALVNGYNCLSQPELVRQHIGFVSANTSIYGRMTAWEMVEYFGKLFGVAGDELRDRMERLFDQLHLQKYRDRLGSTMSTGTMQKVSLARALVHDPPVLILDEPTNGLDILAARTLLDLIAELRDAGKCVVYSTHNMREVERLCDRVTIIYQGKILKAGSLNELRRSHRLTHLDDLFFQLVDKERTEIPPSLSAVA